MKLVVDANVIIAALIKNGKSREILASGKFKFVTSDFVKEEVQKYIPLIKEKSGMDDHTLEVLTALIFEEIETIPRIEYEKELKKAEEIMKEDLKDSTYVACYLALKCDGIWTHDPHYYRKQAIKPFRTIDLVKFLG